MKKKYPLLVTVLLVIASACSNPSPKDKNDMDSIAASPHPTSTDTLLLKSDTVSHKGIDTMHRR